MRINADDVARLRRLVGAPTVARGLEYAALGAVVRCEWDETSTHATGEVRGSADTPYEISLTVSRSDGKVESLDASCSCPVGYNCKHAVALLLSGEQSRPHLTLVRDEPPPPPAVRSPRLADWERPLRGLLAEPLTHSTEPIPSALGLQFELVASRTTPGRKTQGPPGVRLRPVLYSSSGNWVRSGVSWSQLEYYGYGQRLSARAAEQIALLKELRALHGVSSRNYWYGSGDEQVWMESITSRRVWDLLGQAREAGLPLLRSGKEGLPIRLWSDPADVIVDVVRGEDGVRIEPQVRLRSERVDLENAIPIGSPAHGLIWWEEEMAAGRTPELHLAPLSRPLTPDIVELVRGQALLVPPAEQDHFERDVYPRLQGRLPFVSSDGSFAVDAAPAEELVLTIAVEDGARLSLTWSIPYPETEAVGAVRRVASDTAGLVVPTPWGDRLADADLVGMGAARFVSDVLPQLEEIEGLRIQRKGEIPAFREATSLPVVRVDGEQAPSGDWFDLAVEVSVGGEIVPFQALFLALAEEAPYFLLPSGTYFSLDRPELHELARLIAEARTLEDAPPGQARLSRFQASLWEELQEVADVTAQAGAWGQAVAALGEAALVSGERPLPAGLTATLRPYQSVGFQWLASRFDHRLGGILADDMGLGKTLQALALICHAKEHGHSAPFLVIAPTSVVGNWQHEATRFAPGLDVVVIGETERRRRLTLHDAIAGADVVITSYALLRLEIDDYEAETWSGLLLDEAQFAKNPASRNYQAARRIPTPFKLAMTGTPLENSLAELWALTSIVAPGLFANPKHFGEMYRVPIERQADTETLDRLRRRIRPVMLRRTKEQVAADLPDKQEQVLELDLHPRHRKIYQTYLQRERQKILGLIEDMDGNRFEIFRSLTLLRQAALDVALVDDAHAGIPSTKLEMLGEMLPDIVADGHRVLVFSQFTRYLTAARALVEAAGIECCYLDGRTTKRAEVIDRFREGDAPVFLISLKAGGFGLNLTEADYCILLDPWWNPATEAQAVDRVHRIGQTKKVMVYRLVAKETIEEKVMAMKAKKAKLFSSVMDGGGFESGALTAADIRELLG